MNEHVELPVAIQPAAGCPKSKLLTAKEIILVEPDALDVACVGWFEGRQVAAIKHAPPFPQEVTLNELPSGVEIIVVGLTKWTADISAVLAAGGFQHRVLMLDKQPELQEMLASCGDVPAEVLLKAISREVPGDELVRRAVKVLAPSNTPVKASVVAGEAIYGPGDAELSNTPAEAPAEAIEEDKDHREAQSDPVRGIAHVRSLRFLPSPLSPEGRLYRRTEEWIAKGYSGELIPCSRGSNATRHCKWNDGVRDSTVLERVSRGYNLGLRTHKFGAIDIEGSPFADAIFDFWKAKFPNAPVRTRKGSPSRAMLIRIDPEGGWKKHTLSRTGPVGGEDEKKGGLLLELLGSGQYLHIGGPRADKGLVWLEWDRILPAEELHVVTAEQLTALMEELRGELLDHYGVETRIGSKNGKHRTDGPRDWVGKRHVENDLLIKALELIDGTGLDYGEWVRRIAMPIACLSGGDPEVELELQAWSAPPTNADNDCVPGIFRKARAGEVSTPPGPARGLIQNLLREHPVAGREAEAEAVAHRLSQNEAKAVFDEITPEEAAEIDAVAEEIARSTTPDADQDGLLVRADNIAPEKISWVWPGYLAEGKIHIFAGASTAGKSTVAFKFAALVSSGGKFPDGARATPGNVVIWSGEDCAADTIIPRLLAAGAELTRVFIAKDVKVGGKKRAFNPAKDMDVLSRELDKIGGAKLLIVDSIVSAVSGDSHKNAEVRQGLQPLVDLAEKHGCAVIGITHFTKGTQGRDVMERITGSLAFAALARITFFCAVDRDENGEVKIRTFIRGPSNIGKDGGGFEYAIEETDIPAHPGLRNTQAVFGAAVSGTARDILARVEGADDQRSRGAEREEAMSFLRELLKDGPVLAKDAIDAAKDNGFSERTVRRAKDRLGIICRKGSKEEGGRSFWTLPTAREVFNDGPGAGHRF